MHFRKKDEILLGPGDKLIPFNEGIYTEQREYELFSSKKIIKTPKGKLILPFKPESTIKGIERAHVNIRSLKSLLSTSTQKRPKCLW